MQIITYNSLCFYFIVSSYYSHCYIANWRQHWVFLSRFFLPKISAFYLFHVIYHSRNFIAYLIRNFKSINFRLLITKFAKTFILHFLTSWIRNFDVRILQYQIFLCPRYISIMNICFIYIYTILIDPSPNVIIFVMFVLIFLYSILNLRPFS